MVCVPHVADDPAVNCAEFDAKLNGECPLNEGSMCKVSPSPQSRGGYVTENCGNCQKSSGLVRCTNGFTFKFTRQDQVEVTYSAQLVTKVYQAVVKFARTACRTKSKPVTANPFRLTTTPANNMTTNNADISYVQVCYNRKFLHPGPPRHPPTWIAKARLRRVGALVGFLPMPVVRSSRW